MGNSRNEQIISFKLCTVLSRVMKSHAILLCPAPEVNHPLAQCSHTGRHPPRLAVLVVGLTVEVTQEARVTCSCHSPHFVSSRGIVSSHIVARRVSSVQEDILRERPRSHNFIIVYCYDCSISLLVMVVNLFL